MREEFDKIIQPIFERKCELILDEYNRVGNQIIANTVGFITLDIEFIIDMEGEQIIKDYGLEDFEFGFFVTQEKYSLRGNQSVRYYYKGGEIKPECHYTRPDGYVNPLLIDILNECKIQDKRNPNIYHLEVPEKV